MLADGLGNPVSLDDPSSLAGLNDFVEGFIASEARAVNVQSAAQHDRSAIVQACAAALHMFAETRDAAANASPYLSRARAAAGRATARERRFVAAVGAWVEGDIDAAIGLHVEQAREFPRDLASVKLGQYHLFNRGDAPGMLRMALSARPAAADVAYLHGMLAFGYEQCHFLREAEAAARHAIALCRKEPWAHHALAHVMLTEGRLHEGLDFMQGVSDSWTGLNSFMLTHNWWHVALFALDLDRPEEVLRLYDRHVWGVAKDYSQDQINAVSLLARLELAGIDVGDRWQDLADHLITRTNDQVLPFLDLQYLYGLARAGRAEAGLLHDRMARFAESQATPLDTGTAVSNAVWAEVGAPAAAGLLAHARGEFASAAAGLGRALPRLREIGGSHAQRDLFAQLHLDALERSGQLVEAQHLSQQQIRGQPESLRLARQSARIGRALGIA